MDPITATTDVTGALAILQGVAGAAAQGNYWWVISTIIYVLLELAKGRVPGTNIKVPMLPQLLSDNLTPDQVKLIALVGSAVLAGISVLAGRPIEPAAADFATGWLGAMGLHNAVGIVKNLKKPAKTPV